MDEYLEDSYRSWKQRQRMKGGGDVVKKKRKRMGDEEELRWVPACLPACLGRRAAAACFSMVLHRPASTSIPLLRLPTDLPISRCFAWPTAMRMRRARRLMCPPLSLSRMLSWRWMRMRRRR